MSSPDKPKETVGSHAGREAQKIAEQLLKEGGRGAVLLGAARLDLALEKLLKSIMSPHPDGNDNLFHPDRPLGSYSAKIALAFRLSLIDKSVEHALQMIRKVRNEFAHSCEDTSLGNQDHRNRLLRPYNEGRKNPMWAPIESIIDKSDLHEDLKPYITLVVMLVAYIEAASIINTEYLPTITIRMFENQGGQA